MSLTTGLGSKQHAQLVDECQKESSFGQLNLIWYWDHQLWFFDFSINFLLLSSIKTYSVAGEYFLAAFCFPQIVLICYWCSHAAYGGNFVCLSFVSSCLRQLCRRWYTNFQLWEKRGNLAAIGQLLSCFLYIIHHDLFMLEWLWDDTKMANFHHFNLHNYQEGLLWYSLDHEEA